ncbi:ABC transporter permease [Cochleicola gelatinilyticus]|uniref:Excinuclease ABC subunit B n=1 Tax=Cochleicola gelatinilyticus TaxID=1763537 RepID=A0A167K8C3_9FLAO|nr:ABC transporter permease [Cochleicola gelatinilyticus]OAB81493.1 excinuclease ABC subunit B [Cochleicola gelatinilyticus]
MLRLLSIELHKLRFSRSTKIISAVYFILITFIALIASIEFSFGGVNFRIADQGIFNFPFIWHFNTYIAAILKFFLAIVIVSMVSNEYSFRTLKQNLIDGLSKKEFILSKFLTVLLFAVISTLFVLIVSIILGMSFSDKLEWDVIFYDLDYLGAYFLKLVGFFSFCLFLAVLIKRSAFALGFLFIWFILEQITYAMMKWWIFKGTDIADTITQFYPLEAMSNLIKEPWTRLGLVQTAASQLGESFTKNYEVQLLPIIVVSVWTVIFIYGAYALLKKRDL